MKKKQISNVFVHIMLSFLVLVWLVPIAWIVLTSFRAQKGSYSATILPKAYTLSNYTRLFAETDIFNFPQWFMNTFIVAVFSCMISSFFILSVSYAMSRLRFKMRKPFMNVALILGMFPGFMSMIAVYYILKGIGLASGPLKLVALVLIYSAGSGAGFFVQKGFFDTISKSIDEAAIIDGCTKWQVFYKITIPLSKPIIVQTVLNAFIAPWIDFIFAKVIIGSEAKYYTVAIGLWNMLTRENITNFYTRFMAGAVLVSIPISLLFMKLQKYYQQTGAGAVKG